VLLQREEESSGIFVRSQRTGTAFRCEPMSNVIDRLKGIFPEDTHQLIFLVGGAVRDYLLEVENTDIDLAAALTAEEFAALGFHLVEGRSTAPIWQRHVEGLGIIEATQLPDAADLLCDLRRRDFTINAMAITLAGAVIDPLEARSDLKQRLLKACSRRTFIDDPLRVFRAFRFAAAGWRMTPQSEKLLRERDWSRELAAVPVERFSREMLKALAATGPDRFFRLMLEYGIGQGYLPELFSMPDIPAGPLEHHPEGDLFIHSLEVLQRVARLSGDPLTRFCAFFHDIGKLATSPPLYPRHHGHEESGFVTAQDFCRRLRLPAHYGKALSWVSRLHGKLYKWDELRDSTKLRTAEQAIRGGIADLLPLVAAADKVGGLEPMEWKTALRIARLPATELGIDLQIMERVQPSKRTDYLLQKRVERFRSTLTASI
jgi:tRNA nucleotidyltransferase (CCA-adding enzyme)